MKTIIIVNRHKVRAGLKRVFTVRRRGKTYASKSVQILGPSTLVYSPDKPLHCGAKAWLETTSPVRYR